MRAAGGSIRVVSSGIATVIHDALARAGVTGAALKWPNDILIGGKKVAGILTELSAELDKVRYIILGIGIDVNLDVNEFPADLKKTATSLKIETGETVSRAELATTTLRELDFDYARIGGGKFQAVADEWESGCATIGKNVTVHIGDRKIRGRAESLDDDGALLIRTEHGHLERITGGDVTLEK